MSEAIDSAAVVAYLQDNPEFFLDQDDLLASLTLPHESGKAISLLERQVNVLRQRTYELGGRLDSLLDNARDNDKLFDKSRRLTLALLEGEDLGDVIDALRHSFDNDFKIQYTSLLLFGEPHDESNGLEARFVSLKEANAQVGSLIKAGKAYCGSLNALEKSYLFGERGQHIGSAASVPLRVDGQLFGLLVIANDDPNYYRSSMGTLFLSYIGELLNRIIPRHRQPH